MKYMLIAGEASGDLHASQLIKWIREFDPEADFRFFGGDLMAREARRNPDLHYDRMNVMGFSEVLRKLPTLASNMKRAKRLLREYRPDVLVLVDYPGFNLGLAKYAHKIGIPVHYFISPKVWAWKEYRVKSIKRYVDRMYSILPFEVGFYKKHGYDVTYVGNPSVQEVAWSLGHIPPKKHFMERQGLDDDRPIIALLPGSRKGEIRNNLPLMVEAAKRYPEFQYVVGGGSGRSGEVLPRGGAGSGTEVGVRLHPDAFEILAGRGGHFGHGHSRDGHHRHAAGGGLPRQRHGDLI